MGASKESQVNIGAQPGSRGRKALSEVNSSHPERKIL